MGAERAWRWRLLPFRSLSLPPASPSKPKRRPPDVPVVPPSPARNEEEEVPAEFLCPILRAPMADPVILPSGRTYERACVLACADLGLSLGPDGVAAAAEGNAPGSSGGGGGGGAVAIPNDALRAAVQTWCARSGRAAPVAPSAEKAREAVLRAVPAVRALERTDSNMSCPSDAALAPARSASNLSCSSDTAPAPARSASNLSCSSEGASAASTSSSSSSSSSGRSSREMAAAEVEVARRKEAEAAKEKEKEQEQEQEEEPVPVPDNDAEEEAAAKAVEAGDEREVEVAMAALRRATRESSARRRALCAPRLLAALRWVLLSSRHTASARADAAAALANLSLEPENRVPIVRAGAVPALVDAVASPSAPPEAREHAAGALFGLALHEGNRAAIGVLGAVPPLLAVLACRDGDHALRARRDAGMALYHLSLAAVNQSKVARFPGAPKALLAVASGAAEPGPIRRLALMVACNVAACSEGRAALMDAGAVASVAGILNDADGGGTADLEEWCVSAMYAMSRGSLRFRGLARAAGADRALRRVVADEGAGGVRREMARKTLRAMRGDLDEDGEYNDLTGSSLECGDGEDCGGSIVSDGLMSFRRRQRELGVSSCGNTAEF